MKIIASVCAAAMLSLTASAQAQYGAAGMHAYPQGKPASARHVKKPRVAPAPKDPYAAYWKDPSRYEFPSWGMRGGR
jgi:hypothetical protein